MKKKKRKTQITTEVVKTTKTVQRNPPAGSVQIYPASRGVSIQGMKKPFGKGRYRHAFKGPVEIIGLANGDVLLRSPKKR